MTTLIMSKIYVQFIGHMKIFRDLIERVIGCGYFYMKIYRVLTEHSLINSYCHTKIFRNLVEAVVILYENLQGLDTAWYK